MFSIPNDLLLQEGDADQTALNGFEMGNRWILNSLSSLSNVLFKKGLIDQDLGSLKQLFQAPGGKSLFAVTSDTDIFDLGNGGIESLIESLLLNPLLHREDSPKNLDALMIVIQGNQSLELSIIHKVASLIAEKFNFKKDILISAHVDDSLINSLKICIFGKLEIDQIVEKIGPKDDLFSEDEPDSENTLETRKSPNLLKVHRSKLSKRKKKEVDDQKEFAFVDKEDDRGYFDTSVDKFYKGINLDQPTYLRKGIKVKFK
jgi:cell division protein FtsZ